MTLPQTQLKTGLAYRESILLVLAIAESRRPTRIRFADELRKFHHHFNEFVTFPQKNIDHYALMLRKLFKSQSVHYKDNRPVLTAKGEKQVENILSVLPETFMRKWNEYIIQ